jgi:hypothetical protein
MPTVAIDAPSEKPDVSVRRWEAQPAPQPPPAATAQPAPGEPDVEVAVAAIEASTALYVEKQGLLIAAVELVSPRNKDRPLSRSTYLARYAGYLLEGIHLLLVDVHRRPVGFSFADAIAQELQIPQQPSCLPPLAVGYRVGGPVATGGRLLGIWLRSLTAGAPLPVMVLPLTLDLRVEVDLEQTYSRAAADAYLE